MYINTDNYFIGKFNLHRDNFRNTTSIYLLKTEITSAVVYVYNNAAGHMVRATVEFKKMRLAQWETLSHISKKNSFKFYSTNKRNKVSVCATS